ncbi:hypothetical protein SGPA1_41233 [Streptomyces misionensis JCM 4497]
MMRSIVVNVSPVSAAPVYTRPSIARVIEFILASVKKVERVPDAVPVLMLIAVLFVMAHRGVIGRVRLGLVEGRHRRHRGTSARSAPAVAVQVHGDTSKQIRDESLSSESRGGR